MTLLMVVTLLRNKNTALTIASSQGYDQVVDLLSKYGEDTQTLIQVNEYRSVQWILLIVKLLKIAQNYSKLLKITQHW